MAQHDYNIANATFPSTRSDINDALSAVASNNSGTSAPSTTFANQWFYETDTNKLQIRNEDNDAFIQILELDQSNDKLIGLGDSISIATTGGVSITTADNTDTLTLTSTDADANAAPNLRLYRNSSSAAPNDVIGQIDIEGRNDNSQDVVYQQYQHLIADETDGTEDGYFIFSQMKAGTLTERFRIETGTFVINDPGADFDFRIEGDNTASLFFVDASTDRVGINTSSPATTLDVAGNATITTSDNTDTLTLTCTDADATAGPRLRIFRNSASPADSDRTGDIRFESKNDAAEDFICAQMMTTSVDVSDGTEDGQLLFKIMRAGTLTEFMRFDPGSGGIVVNDGGGDHDFRVESQVGTHAFFVNGASGNGTAGFYSASDSYQLMIENQNASGGRVGVFVNNPSSSDTGTGFNARSARSASLDANFYILTSSNNGSDTEFKVRGDGNVFCDGAFSGGGADYAEYFEWADGNSSDEDRVGYSVVLDNNKIVKATDSDDASKIIGVISVNPAVIGDDDIDRWKQKFLLDDFGREITEEITVTEWRGEHTTEEGIFNNNHLYSYDTDRIPNDVTVPSDAEVKTVDDNGNKFLRRKTNPDWNESETYISREDRKEWDTVGLMGKLRLRKGQPTGTNWIKMRDISDSVEEWLVR